MAVFKRSEKGLNVLHNLPFDLELNHEGNVVRQSANPICQSRLAFCK